jgi:hypothetical protein
MLGKLLREVNIDALGPKSFAALMCVIHSDSYPAMQKIKRKLELIKLSQYRGEDIKECCDNILTCCGQLNAAGAFVPNLLCIWLCSSCSNWWMGQVEKSCVCQSDLAAIRQLDIDGDQQ